MQGDEFTPTTDYVRAAYRTWADDSLSEEPDAEFDRWLASPDARAAVLGDRDTLREKVAKELFRRLEEPMTEGEAFDLNDPGDTSRFRALVSDVTDAVLDVFYPKGDDSE